MKKFNKNTAIILSIIMFVVLAIGFVLSFVPIQFKNGKFVSLSKTINVSTDLVGGMYGEYNIKTENPTQKDIIDTVSLIREVLGKQSITLSNPFDATQSVTLPLLTDLKISFFTSSAGAFVTMGILLAVIAAVRQTKEEKAKKGDAK